MFDQLTKKLLYLATKQMNQSSKKCGLMGIEFSARHGNDIRRIGDTLEAIGDGVLSQGRTPRAKAPEAGGCTLPKRCRCGYYGRTSAVAE